MSIPIEQDYFSLKTLDTVNNLNSKDHKEQRQTDELQASLAKYLKATQPDQEILFREYYFLYRIATTLSEQINTDCTIREVKKIVSESFSAKEFSFILLDDKTQSLYIKTSFGIAESSQISEKDYHYFKEILEKKSCRYVQNLDVEPVHIHCHPGTYDKKGAFLSVPLITSEQGAIGVINLYRSTPNSFKNQEIDLLKKITRQAGQVISKINIYQKTHRLSITDELTGVFNRRYFNKCYEWEYLRALRYDRLLSVILLDIDQFKIYNDTFGHLSGDTILKCVANILNRNIRKADILARFGGEEFVIVLPEISKEKSLMVAEKLRAAIEQTTIQQADEEALGKITVSLGVASFPEDTKQSESLMFLADKALYQAKFRGRNQVVSADSSFLE